MDGFARLVIRSDREGELVDFAEWPFDAECMGIGWDGDCLWITDIDSAAAWRARRAGD